jgi:hypothetical protein
VQPSCGGFFFPMLSCRAFVKTMQGLQLTAPRSRKGTKVQVRCQQQQQTHIQLWGENSSFLYSIGPLTSILPLQKASCSHLFPPRLRLCNLGFLNAGSRPVGPSLCTESAPRPRGCNFAAASQSLHRLLQPNAPQPLHLARAEHFISKNITNQELHLQTQIQTQLQVIDRWERSK